MDQLYRGHNYYAADNKQAFPHPDWWLWDNTGAAGQSVFFPGIYSKTGGTRPLDSSRWVEFGKIFRYVKDKEVYFCSKDSKRRTGNGIGSPPNGNKPIHSYVRIVHPNDYYGEHIGDANDILIKIGSSEFRKSDHIGPDQLRKGVFSPRYPNYNSTPNRVALMYEEWQYNDEPRNGVTSNAESTLNDGYSGFTEGYVDYISMRHFGNKSHLLFWDGHSALVDGIKFNVDVNDKFSRAIALGAPK
jgi:prepilin-type processing-associated H-X9-DG protein